MGKNKRSIYFAVGTIYLIVTLLYLAPSDSVFSIARILQGNKVKWRHDSLLLPDGYSSWFVKGEQLQVNYRVDGAPWISFDSMENPSKFAKDYANHFCATTTCVKHTEFAVRMGAHETKCVKFMYSDFVKDDVSLIFSGVDDISVMTKDVGFAAHAATAFNDMSTLVAQMR